MKILCLIIEVWKRAYVLKKRKNVREPLNLKDNATELNSELEFFVPLPTAHPFHFPCPNHFMLRFIPSIPIPSDSRYSRDISRLLSLILHMATIFNARYESSPFPFQLDPSVQLRHVWVKTTLQLPLLPRLFRILICIGLSDSSLCVFIHLKKFGVRHRNVLILFLLYYYVRIRVQCSTAIFKWLIPIT